jgi:hypothetical protein
MLTAISLIGLTLGCGHTAGVCDCDQPTGPCCYGPGAAPVATAEPIKVLPRDTTRELVPVPADKTTGK